MAQVWHWSGIHQNPSSLERRMHIHRRRTGVRFSPSLLGEKPVERLAFFINGTRKMAEVWHWSGIHQNPSTLELRMHIHRRRTGVRFSPSLLGEKPVERLAFFINGTRKMAEVWHWSGIHQNPSTLELRMHIHRRRTGVRFSPSLQNKKPPEMVVFCLGGCW